MDRNNQRQRSKAGARVVKSKQELEQDKIRRIDKQLERASDLEEQLGSLAAKNNNGDENKSYKLRSHLCEILSDVLISDPKRSLENNSSMDCFQRLWRGCFYNPITIWRHRLSREKRKRSPNLANTQEGFRNFLSEAVTLYDYLVLQYLTKLVPSATQDVNSTQQSSLSYDRSQLEDTQFASQTQSTTTITSKQTTTSSLEGVVQGLYKLYIFLGDLHRYAEAYNKAEACYWNASKLGPGLGNSYNQLAVVAFAKDTYCVALYWHVRSLLVTHGRFSTSSVNLERLFAMNRRFLEEHGRDAAPVVFSQPLQSSKKDNNNNHAMIRAQKTAASKSCLTHFVDLHYDLYLQQQQNNADGMETDEGRSLLVEKIRNVVSSLNSLVKASGFSDALLCKMVVINTFSLESASRGTLAKEMSEELAFSMGLVLAEHTEGLLAKALEKPTAKQKSAPPSIRCLLPLEMLLEFVNLRLADENEQTKTKTSTTEIEFWNQTVTVGNLVQKLVQTYNFNSANKENASWTQIHEYKLLKGYRPFSIVNEKYSTKEDGLLDPAEAVDVLELSASATAPSQLSQDTGAISTITTGGTSSSGGGAKENKARLLRLLEICDLLASSSGRAPMVLKQGNYCLQGTTNHEEDMDTAIANDSTSECDDSDDEAGDRIVYHEDKEPTNITSLLLPKAHSVTATSKTDMEEKVDNPFMGQKLTIEQIINVENVAMELVPADEEEKSANPVGASMVKPPPGFGGASPSTTTIPVQMGYNGAPLLAHHLTPASKPPGLVPPANTGSMIDQILQGRVKGGPSAVPPFFQMPQQQQPYSPMVPIPGLMANSINQDPTYPTQTGRSNLATSVEDSIRVFGDMRTANPYAAALPYGAPLSSNNTLPAMAIHNNNDPGPPSVMIPGFLDHAMNTNSAVDDSAKKWLNSNLLNSLWVDESTNTNNPWAAK